MGDFCDFDFGEGLAVAVLFLVAALRVVFENDFLPVAGLAENFCLDLHTYNVRPADLNFVPVHPEQNLVNHQIILPKIPLMALLVVEYQFEPVH